MQQRKQPGDVFSPNVVYEINLEQIVVSPFEPQARRRAKFKPDELDSLGDSIKTHGLAQPIVLRINKTGLFEIVFGERRFLASGCKTLKTILAFVRELDDKSVLELQYEENHRQQQNDPLDDAFFFQYLIDNQGYTEEALADRFNKTKREITDALKLNDLISEARAELADGSLPLRHAVYLAKFPAEMQKEIVRQQLAYKYQNRSEKSVSFEIFKQEVEENIIRRLINAPFAKDDPRLHVRGLLCRACPDNSASITHLFPEFAGEARCLNKSCFEVKTSTHLRLQRDSIAVALPNPTQMPIEEIAAEIPLVTERKYTSDRVPFPEKVLTSQELLDAPECEFSELSLAVEGTKKGQQVYICRNEQCPVHHPQPALNDLSDDELTQYEIEFDQEVERRVRRKILGAAMEWFDHYKSFWAFDDLVKNLITSVLFERGRSSDGGAADDVVLQLVRGFKNAPKSFKDRDRLREFVETLDKTNQSRILFLLSAAGADEVEFLKIAADYTTLGFLHLDAETRLELAPPVFRAKAQEYLDAVRSGNICDVPRLSRTAGSYDFVETVFDDAK